MVSSDNYVIITQYDILNEMLPFSILRTFWSDIMEYDNQSNNMLDYFTLGDTTQWDTAKCYFTSKSPLILDWSKAYMNNKDIEMMLKIIF